MILPQKLKKGDEVRVVAPSLSYKIIAQDLRDIATKRLQERGLEVSFGKNVEICNKFASSSIEERIADLHDAFLDENVKAIFSVIGGYNANELLPYLDYNLIKENPKFVIGYSDTTALLNAIHAKTGFVTYYGPAFSTLGMKKGADYILSNLDAVLFKNEPIDYIPSTQWSDDAWFLDQENRNFYKNQGPITINTGTTTGRLIGGEMTTFQLLLNTPYLPSFDNSILALEITDVSVENSLKITNRILHSLSQHSSFPGVKGIIFGRFEQNLNINLQDFIESIRENQILKNIPIVCNMDFGHTFPMTTLPIGKNVSLSVSEDKVNLSY